jgi:hypothetical protein
MARILNEQLYRMYSLIYGKEKINNKLNTLREQAEKAELVTDDVTKFFDNLQNIKTPLTQQQRGSMTFQKDVETFQIGLLLLGYELPRFGVDGKFGPETARAVMKFTEDNLKNLSESSTKLRSTLNQLGYDEKGSEISSGGEITNELSTIVSDILKDFKQTNPNVDVVITAGNDRYHKTLNYNSKHKVGQAIDLVIKPYSRQNAQSLISVLEKYRAKDNKFYYLDEYTNPTKAATGGHFHLQYSDGSQIKQSGEITNAVVTDKFVEKMIEMLRAKNIQSSDIKQYTSLTSGDNNLFTDLDLSTDEGYKKYKDICQKFIETRRSNLLRINGDMLASAAKRAFEKYGKYVPPELALSQLTLEGGFSDNPNHRPIKTKNPFNVGNVDSGGNKYFDSVQSSINTYYDLIAKNYLTGGKTAADLMKNFVNRDNNRYATAGAYERGLLPIAKQVKSISNKTIGDEYA